jgi:hypothetical protein
MSQAGDLMTTFEKNGYKTTIKTEEDKSYVVATQTSPKGKWCIPYFEKFSKEPAKIQPKFSNYIFVKVYKLKANYVLDENLVNQALSGMKDNEFLDNIQIPFRYVITVPGKITQNNADEVNGNTMVWNYTIKANEKVNLELVSYEVNYPAVIILLIVIFLIIIASLKRKKVKWDTVNSTTLANK